MADQLQKKIASEDELVLRLHAWRIAQKHGRAAAAEIISAATGLKLTARSLEIWEQGRSNPSEGRAILIGQFLAKY